MKRTQYRERLPERKVIQDDDQELRLQRAVEFEDLTKLHILDSQAEDDNGIRIYGGSACAVLQLRGYGPLTDNGKPKRMIATATYLGADEIDRIIKRLQTLRKRMREPIRGTG